MTGAPSEQSPWARIIQDCMLFLLVAVYDMQVHSIAILNFAFAIGLDVLCARYQQELRLIYFYYK